MVTQGMTDDPFDVAESDPADGKGSWVPVAGTYMSRRRLSDPHTWVYRINLACQTLVTDDMLVRADLNLESVVYRNLLGQMMGLCQSELIRLNNER